MRNVRLFTAVSLVLVLLLTMILAACAAPAPAPAPASKPATSASPSPAPAQAPAGKANWPKNMSLVTARPGSSVYTITAGITKIITDKVGIKTIPESGSLGQLITLVNKGEAELGDLQGFGLFEAGRGIGQYKDAGPMKVRQLWKGYTPPSAFITKRSDNIMSVEQLKGKTVMCVYKGNPDVEEGGRMIMEAGGMTFKDVVAMPFTGREEGWPAVKEGRVAAFIFPLGGGEAVPPWLQEGNIEQPTRLVTTTSEKMTAMASKYDYAEVVMVPAKTFKDIVDNKDLASVGTPHYIYANANLPEDLVYEIMKVVFTSKEDLYAMHPDAVAFMKDPVLKPVIPFHPGAIKYFKEIGKWSAEQDAAQARLLKEVGASK